MKLILFLVLFAVLNSPALALHLSSQSLNLPGDQLVENTEILINHRFYGNVGDNLLDNLLGMSGGANVILGMGFRPISNLDLTILRASLEKEYSLAGKARLSDDLSLVLGVTDKTSPAAASNKTSFFGQLIYTKEIFPELQLSLVPTITNPKPESPTVALGLSAGYSIDYKIGYFENIELIAEAIPVISGYAQKFSTAAMGVKIKTFGHFFTLLITNAVQGLAPGYSVGSADNTYHFGFNILRKI